MKGLLGPTEAGGFDCRYHPAVLPKYRPRIWTLNSGIDQRGEVWYEEWFEQQDHVLAIGALSRGDTDWLSRGSAHDQAVARRCFVVHIATPLYEVPADCGACDHSLSNYFAAGLKRKFWSA